MININIEPCNFCNSSCSYCLLSRVNSSHSAGGNCLPLSVHNSLFQGLNDFICNPLCLPTKDKSVNLRYCGIGEPTLHPQAIQMFVAGLLAKQVVHFSVLSNGVKWDNGFTDEFIRGVLSDDAKKPIELIFNLDTINPETQYKIKKMNNIQTVNNQIGYLLEQKVKYDLRNIHVICQMIIMDENQNEAEEFCRFWEDVFKAHKISSRIVHSADYSQYFRAQECFVWIKRMDSDVCSQKRYADLHKKVIERLRLGEERVSDQNIELIENLDYAPVPAASNENYAYRKNICSVFWYGINLFATGDVTPCCIDAELSLKIGNLKTESIEEMYSNNQMKMLRLAHIKADFSDYPLCRHCEIPALYRYNQVSKDDVENYLRCSEL